MTRMSFEQHCKIADATLYSAKKAYPEKYIPLKTSDVRMRDVTKYGGYTKAKIAYYFLAKHQEGKQTILSIEGLPLYCKSVVEADEKGLEHYCEEQFGYQNAQILLEKIKIQSLLEINGYRVYLSGKSNDSFVMRNAVNLHLSEKWVKYIKKIEKQVETGIQSGELSELENQRLYDILVDKHMNGIYAKRPSFFGKKLSEGKQNFETLSLEEQCNVLCQMLQLTKPGVENSANLELIKKGNRCGIITMNKKIKAKDKIFLINQSVTGLFENKIDLLKL